MHKTTFLSTFRDRGAFKADWDQETIKNEPMFFNSDLIFALENGGPITRKFITSLPKDWIDCNAVLDSRVHMLMPNWYPCIPGWHHDDVPRSTPTGQPNYLNPEYRSEHLMGLVNGDICPTNFIDDMVDVSLPDFTKRQYNVWNDEIDAQTNLNRVKAPSGRLIQFDSDSFHTGVKAVAGGWRWFIRLSRKTDRQKNITNEIRRQVQVYLEEPMAGW
jgi:hypothetical protein